MGADPQFGKRSARRVFHAQQIRDEVVAAPVVVLHHTLQRQYDPLQPSTAFSILRRIPAGSSIPMAAIASARLCVSATA